MVKLFIFSPCRQAKACEEYVGDLLDGGEKHLVFAHHRVLLDAIESLLRK